MYERILVPLKWHSSDEAVMEHIGFLARLTGGQVTLAHVVHSHSRDESAYLEDQARAYLAVLADRLGALGVPAATRVIQGEPAAAITALSQELDADLIIMATHGHSEVRHVFVGSVTEDVVRNGATPVLLIRPKDGGG